MTWIRAFSLALLYATFLFSIYRLRLHPAAYAEGKDDNVWQGSISVATKIDANNHETHNDPAAQFTSSRDDRVHEERTSAYSGLHLTEENEENWKGPATVDFHLTQNEYHSFTETSSGAHHDEGQETSVSASSGGLQGEVELNVVASPDDPHKGSCSLSFHGLSDVKYSVDGHEWNRTPDVHEFVYGRDTGRPRPEDNWDHPIHKELTTAPERTDIEFDCDPQAVAYSGQKEFRPQQGETRLVTWNLHRGAVPETEVELIPASGYDRWRPQAGEDEEKLGNFIDVEILAHKKGGPSSDPPKKVLRYKIELEDTSKEKGVDANWPPKSSAKATYDMEIDKDSPWITVTDKEGQHAETKEDQEGLTDFTVTVDSYDWGGYTKLHVTAELEDHSTVVAHVHGHPDHDFLLVPKDDNSNHIADGWEHEYGLDNSDPAADEDSVPPGDYDRGDNIALYDEYRGFHISGQHERLSPKTKDLFIFDPSDLGIGLYGDTGVRTHMIFESEYFFTAAHLNHQVVTPNSTYGDVCALWIREGPLDPGVIGETMQVSGMACDVESITISPASAAGFGSGWPEYLRSSIAHELSHATNVPHHGPDDVDYLIGDALCRVPDTSGHPGTEGTLVTVNYPCSTTPRDKNGKAIGPGRPGSDCWEVAVQGGKYSGNDQCWMRYDQTNFYEDPAGNCQWQHNGKTIHGRLYGEDLPGMSICDSKDGTGVNDPKKKPNKAGNATYGDCKHRLCLKHKRG
jgi:hypothetical protein